MNELFESVAESKPTSEAEYIGEDGLKHCAVCHVATEALIKNPFTYKEHKVRCICECRQKELNAHKESERQRELERQRRTCFAETNMATWTFENDDRRNAKLSDVMRNYVKNFTDFRKDGKGLLLYGPVGTGKTYYAAAIANKLIDEGFTVYMTKFTDLVNVIQSKSFQDKPEFIESINRYSLLIIDDLGTERESQFMQEQVFNIIDSRYRSGLPFIITTNLSWDEIKKPQNIQYARIYDRIIERCFPVQVAGVSRRRQAVVESYETMKSKLGI
jgi:DNA replication protein DnaC